MPKPVPAPGCVLLPWRLLDKPGVTSPSCVIQTGFGLQNTPWLSLSDKNGDVCSFWRTRESVLPWQCKDWNHIYLFPLLVRQGEITLWNKYLPQPCWRAPFSSLGLVTHQAAVNALIFPITWCVGCRMWAISYLCCLETTFWNHPLACPSFHCTGGQKSQQDIWLVGRRDKGERLLSVLMWYCIIPRW